MRVNYCTKRIVSSLMYHSVFTRMASNAPRTTSRTAFCFSKLKIDVYDVPDVPLELGLIKKSFLRVDLRDIWAYQGVEEKFRFSFSPGFWCIYIKISRKCFVLESSIIFIYTGWSAFAAWVAWKYTFFK